MSSFEPFHIARRFASLDHPSNGRAGWNIVTTSNPDAALNFRREYEGTTLRENLGLPRPPKATLNKGLVSSSASKDGAMRNRASEIG